MCGQFAEEYQLVQELERLRLTVAAAGIGTWDWDPLNDRATWSEKNGELLGLPHGTVTSYSTFLATVHPDDRQRVAEALSSALAGEVNYEVECRVIWPDGTPHWFLGRGHVIRDATGKPIRMVGVSVDISDRKRIQEEREQLLAERECQREFLRRLVDNAPIGIAVINARDGRYILTNPTYEAVPGRPVPPMVGHQVGEFSPPATAAFMQWVLQHVVQTGQPFSVREHEASMGPGREHTWWNNDVVPLLNEAGHVESVLALTMEVTEQVQARKRIEELAAQMQASRDQLETMNQALEQRVAVRTAEVESRSSQLRRLVSELTEAEQRERRQLAQMLHDHLQQLLVGAKLNLGAIRPPGKDEALRQSLTKVDDLLSQAIAASRSLTVELSPPILYQEGLVAVLHWLAQWMHEKHGLAIEVQADPQADPQAQDMRLLLFQSVRELLFNVVKHAKVDRAIVEMSRAEGDMVQIAVSDAGAGFDLAQRLAERTVEGRFGLFSIQERLESMGGQMEIASAPGQGTRVVLRAPIHPPGRPAVPRQAPPSPGLHAHRLAAPPPQEQPPTERSDKIRVLLADDHDLVREGLAKLLQAEPDIEVVAQAWDGQMALERTIVTRPDVVVMDVSMPGMDGVEAAQLLKAEMPEIHVIALSMHDEKQVAAAMAEAGAATYVNKAAPSELLIDAIRLCGRRR